MQRSLAHYLIHLVVVGSIYYEGRVVNLRMGK